MIFLASEGKEEYDVRGLRFVDFLVVSKQSLPSLPIPKALTIS